MKLVWSFSHEIRELFSCNITDTRPYNIFLIKSFDEEVIEYPWDYNEKRFNSWISTYSSPIVMDLNEENIQMAYGQKIPSVMYFYKHEDIFEASNIKELSESYKPFYQFGKKYSVYYYLQNSLH